jgi:hypothetical protein
MDDRGPAAATRCPEAPALRVTCRGVGAPPFSVLARVSHVFCGRDGGDVWEMVERELRAGAVAATDLVLLRVGRGAAEEWTELSVTRPS